MLGGELRISHSAHAGDEDVHRNNVGDEYGNRKNRGSPDNLVQPISKCQDSNKRVDSCLNKVVDLPLHAQEEDSVDRHHREGDTHVQRGHLIGKEENGRRGDRNKNS